MVREVARNTPWMLSRSRTLLHAARLPATRLPAARRPALAVRCASASSRREAAAAAAAAAPPVEADAHTEEVYAEEPDSNNLTERVLTALHYAVAGTLVAISIGGLTFLSCGLYEIWTKANERKRKAEALKLKLEQNAESSSAAS